MINRIRESAKYLAQGGLVSSVGMSVLRRRARGRSVILGYHNVIPDDEPLTGEASVHIRVAEFLRQVALLEEHCDIVPLDRILRSDPLIKSGRLRAALTFDDAYAGAVRLALPALASKGLPCTVFVPSGFVGGATFWWDDLQCSGWEGDRIPLEKLAGRDAAIRQWAVTEGIESRVQTPFQRTATREDLLATADLPGVSFGVHTVGHPNLARLRPPEVRQELLASRDWILRESLPFSNWVAYPYGLADASVAQVAQELEFDGGLRITGGWIPQNRASPFLLPRAVIPAGIPEENFLIRLYGLVRG